MTENQIMLDALDGSGFEELCAEIYRRLGYQVQNIQNTGDEGRDLILTSPAGETIVAECKHWPRGTVGRPVVQKLHSAIITLPARRGILLTTGIFARQAYDYVKKLGEPIELVDGLRIKDLAAKVGMTIVSGDDPVPILTFRIPEADELKERLDTQVLSSFMSSPASPPSLFFLTNHVVRQMPTYAVRYALDQDFATSIGIVHRIQEPDGYLIVDGQDGSVRPLSQTVFLRAVPVMPLAQCTTSTHTGPERTYTIGRAELTDIAKQHIVELHRTTVRYRGRNDRTYVKECTPSKRNIFLKDIRQVYVPEHELGLEVLRHNYRLRFVDNGREIHWLQNPDIFTCEVCKKSAERRLLCNSCGAIAHPPRLIRAHSFSCKACKKTICKRCTYGIRRWLLFRSILCQECASVYPEKKVQKLVK